ncbi:MAG: hypothetical protein EBR82_20200 [Caulobacteraceae bacterium]|nr:hypothetical protein [Caulobacteraceae bacterium]
MGRPFKESVLQDVAAVVKTAWSPAQIEIDRAQLAADNFPYANVALVGLDRLTGSPTEQTYTYSIKITGRFAYPNSATAYIGTEKIDRANDLTDALMSDITLNAVSYGTLQDVTSVDFQELDGTNDRCFEIQVNYQIAITGTMRP